MFRLPGGASFCGGLLFCGSDLTPAIEHSRNSMIVILMFRIVFHFGTVVL